MRRWRWLFFWQSRDGRGVDGGVTAEQVLEDKGFTALFGLRMTDRAMTTAGDGNQKGRDTDLLKRRMNDFSMAVSDALVGGAVKSEERGVIRTDVAQG